MQKERLPCPSPSSILNPSTSSLKSDFDLPQFSVSFNVQNDGIALFLKKASSFPIQNRAVIKSGGLQILPSYNACGPRLLSLEQRRKIDPKEIPSCLIPCLLVVFTRQLENLVTNPAEYACFAGYLAINL